MPENDYGIIRSNGPAGWDRRRLPRLKVFLCTDIAHRSHFDVSGRTRPNDRSVTGPSALFAGEGRARF